MIGHGTTLKIKHAGSIANGLIVSGSITPADAIGVYTRIDDYNDLPAYKHIENDYWVWATTDVSGNEWYITSVLGGGLAVECFIKPATENGADGSYPSENGATGTATVITTKAIGKITNLSLPELQVDDVDVTDMLTDDNCKKYEGALIAGGEVSLDINYAVDGYEVISSLVGSLQEILINYPDGSKIEFDGVLNGFSGDMPLDDKITNPLTITVSGEPVFTE